MNKVNPVTRNRTRDHLIAALIYSQMLCQLSYDRLATLDLGHRVAVCGLRSVFLRFFGLRLVGYVFRFACLWLAFCVFAFLRLSVGGLLLSFLIFVFSRFAAGVKRFYSVRSAFLVVFSWFAVGVVRFALGISWLAFMSLCFVLSEEIVTRSLHNRTRCRRQLR